MKTVATQARDRVASRIPGVAIRWLHQRRQVLAAQPTHRRRRARPEPALRHLDPTVRPPGTPAAVPSPTPSAVSSAAGPARREPSVHPGGWAMPTCCSRRRRLPPRPGGPDLGGPLRPHRRRRASVRKVIVVNKATSPIRGWSTGSCATKHAIAVSAHTSPGHGGAAATHRRVPVPDILVGVLVPYSRGDLVSRVPTGRPLTRKFTSPTGPASRPAKADLAADLGGMPSADLPADGPEGRVTPTLSATSWTPVRGLIEDLDGDRRYP